MMQRGNGSLGFRMLLSVVVSRLAPLRIVQPFGRYHQYSVFRGDE
jgi:hypothetical protein